MLAVAIDVQHLYRGGIHRGDQGTIFTLENGTHISESHCASVYAGALRGFLASQGARTITNDPATGLLCGPYSRRNLQARAWGADLYLACHVNAGGGSYARLESMRHPTTSAAPAVLSGNSLNARTATLRSYIGSELLGGLFHEIHAWNPVVLYHGDRGAVCIEAFSGIALIVEPFFGDNPEMQSLMSADRLVELGQAIGRGVWHWWGAL